MARRAHQLLSGGGSNSATVFGLADTPIGQSRFIRVAVLGDEVPFEATIYAVFRDELSRAATIMPVHVSENPFCIYKGSGCF